MFRSDALQAVADEECLVLEIPNGPSAILSTYRVRQFDRFDLLESLASVGVNKNFLFHI